MNKMRKLSIFTKHGEHQSSFGPNEINFEKGAKMRVTNICVRWRFKNVNQTNTDVVKVADDGTRTVITFGEGFWTLFQMAKRFEEEGIELTFNAHDNTCRIFCKDAQLELGQFGVLLGFPENKVVTKGMYSDSGVVNITQHLEYITLGCDLIDREKNTDRYGQRSNVIATLPIDTTQNLNGSFTHYKDLTFVAPVKEGEKTYCKFTIEDNTKSRQVIKCYLSADIFFE